MVQWKHNLFNLVLCLQKKGCSLDGREAYNLLKSKKVMDLVSSCKFVGKVKFGDPMLPYLASEYSRLRIKN